MIYNLDKIREMADGDEEFIQSVISVFLEEVPEDLGGLESAVGMGDYEQIYKHPSPGTDERNQYRRHVEVGERILRDTGLDRVAAAIRHHHERWDGRGYPDRLSNVSIPFLARMVHVAEVYDVLTGSHSYRRPVGPQRALSIIKSAAGHQFDPEVVEQQLLGAHHVTHHDDRELQVVGLAGPRVGAGRSGGAETGTDDVRTDDIIAVGIEDFTRPDHLVPPARFAVICLMAPRGMGVTGPGMRDQYGVASILIQYAVCFIGKCQGAE